MRKKLLTFLFLLPLVLASVQATNLTSCQTINASDYYHLNVSLNNDTSTCLTVNVSDVVVDCDGYNITFAGTDESAVYSPSFDNVTVKDCNIYQNASDTSLVFAVKIDSTTSATVFNNSITVHGNNSTGIYSQLSSGLNFLWNNVTNNANFGSGINSFENNDTNIRFNKVETNGLETTGVQYSDNNNIVFVDNNVTTHGEDSNGVVVGGGGNSTENATVSKNTVTTYGASSHAITDFSTQNADITFNTVSTNQSGSRGIFLTEISNSNLSYNDVTTLSDNSHAVYLIQFGANDTNNNNWIGYNTLNVSTGSYCVGVIEFVPYIGIFQKLFIVDNTLYDTDETDDHTALFIDGYWNNTELIDQEVSEYFFEDTLFSYENTTFGLVNFTEGVTANGSYRVLSDDLVLSDNFVFVNSSVLNGTANVTLYGIGDRGFTIPAIFKDGVVCGDCTAYTGLTADNVSFGVTGFSNYSIGESYTAGTRSENLSVLGSEFSGMLTNISPGLGNLLLYIGLASALIGLIAVVVAIIKR